MRVQEGQSFLNLAFFVNRGFLPPQGDRGKVIAQAVATPQCKTGQRFPILRHVLMTELLKFLTLLPLPTS